MNLITLPASYYQQFDADHDRDVPGEGYGGWQQTDLELDLDHTAVVVMHAWECGTRERYPGWYRAVEYIPRAQSIIRSIFPSLLAGVRAQRLNLFHVVGGGEYYKKYPGYLKAAALAGPEQEAEQTSVDPSYERLRQFRAGHVFVGSHNEADVKRGFDALDFPPEVRPAGDEGIAEHASQLFALCKQRGVNHLIYAGFAINWCLLMSPGGMLDMARRGFICSAFRQAVTAVESRETAREERNKAEGLWRVALAFGFVFDVDDFVRGLSTSLTK